MTNPTYEPEIVETPENPQQVTRFLRRMLHFWPAVVIAVGLAALACSAFVYLRHPPYRSETVLLYSAGVSTTDTEQQSGNPRNATVRLKELLMSRPKLGAVVKEFGLYRETQQKYGAEDAVEELKRHIEFKAPGGDTFSIAFTGASPVEAQHVTAALAKSVIDGDAELRKSQAELSRDFLANERTSKATDLKLAEERLAAFMGQHRRFALDATPLVAGAAIRATSAIPTAVPTTYTWSRSRPAGAAAQGPAHAASTPAAPGAPSPDAEERARATAALAAAQTNLADLLRRFTPAHPDVKAAQGQVERATERLAALGPAPKPVAAAPTPAPTVEPAEPATSPRRAVAVARPVTPQAPAEKEDVVALETEWAKLTREVTAARQRLDQVEAALFKADVLASSERAGRAVQISVIDPAYVPQRPVGLPLTVIIGLFLGVGVVLGLVAATLGAAVDDRIYTAFDLTRVTGVLAEVPRTSFRRRTYAPE